MPYTLEESRKAVREKVGNVADPGDLTFLLTCKMLLAYIAVPKFVTIHAIKKDFVTDKKANKFLQHIRDMFADRFTVSDIYACSELAYDEFNRRVVAAHEQKKLELNGDLAEFKEALALIEAMK